MIVPQYTEVSEMSVFVVDHRVKYKHAFKTFGKIVAERLVIIKASLNADRFYNPSDRYKRSVNIGEYFTFGR